MDNKLAIDLLSMIEFEHAECCLNTWYKGIDDDMKEALDMAIEALEQKPFMYKPCVAHQVCHEDKVKVLDKIRAEIGQVAEEENKVDKKWAQGLKYTLKIIDKYRESEE